MFTNSQFAFIFPGQGSQSVGMLAELALRYPVIERTFQEASVVLGYDLWSLVQQGPKDELDRTDLTQPAMLAAGVAVWRTWHERGGALPQLMAGHSLGEYTALVCAGALDFGNAIAIVADRGRFMQEAVPAGQGAMAAVLGLDDHQVRSACEQAAQGDVVEPVNFNAPGQVVIAGSQEAVDRAIDVARQLGAKRAMLLAVSVPSHCTLMRPAAARLADRLGEIPIRPPRIPVVHNVDVGFCEDPNDIRDRLVRQLYSPVRWVECVHLFAAEGIRTVIECGPGKVLAGLNRRIHKDLAVTAVYDPASLDQALQVTGELCCTDWKTKSRL